MKEQTREEPGIIAAAERQMHAWAMTHEIEDRSAHDEAEHSASQRDLSFVAISREAGAGGGEIGQAVGGRLEWPVFDKNLLDCIADRFHLPRMMLDLVDETHANWVYDVLGTWMDRKLVPHEKFVACLTRVVLAAARSGHAVFVGRGAQLILPRRTVLAVRLVASLRYRVRQIMDRQAMNEADARRYAIDLDEGRRQFVEQFFHCDIADPHNFDLVIDVERCGKAGAVEQIVTALGK
jgi:hypothetical protein